MMAPPKSRGCIKCGKLNHSFIKCTAVNTENFGLDGCPRCNDMHHNFGECADAGSISRFEQWKYCIKFRDNTFPLNTKVNLTSLREEFNESQSYAPDFGPWTRAQSQANQDQIGKKPWGEDRPRPLDSTAASQAPASVPNAPQSTSRDRDSYPAGDHDIAQFTFNLPGGISASANLTPAQFLAFAPSMEGTAIGDRKRRRDESVSPGRPSIKARRVRSPSPPSPPSNIRGGRARSPFSRSQSQGQTYMQGGNGHPPHRMRSNSGDRINIEDQSNARGCSQLANVHELQAKLEANHQSHKKELHDQKEMLKEMAQKRLTTKVRELSSLKSPLFDLVKATIKLRDALAVTPIDTVDSTLKAIIVKLLQLCQYDPEKSFWDHSVPAGLDEAISKTLGHPTCWNDFVLATSEALPENYLLRPNACQRCNQILSGPHPPNCICFCGVSAHEHRAGQCLEKCPCSILAFHKPSKHLGLCQ